MECVVEEGDVFKPIFNDVEKDAIHEMDIAEVVPSILKKSCARHLDLKKLTVGGSKPTNNQGRNNGYIATHLHKTKLRWKNSAY